MQIAIIGLGVVGGAMHESFSKKGQTVVVYDKYKNIGNIKDCMSSDICFVCVPSPLDNITKDFDLSELYFICNELNNKYSGLVVIKTTVSIGTTNDIFKRCPQLKLVHNPEFLSAKTALYDFDNQVQIVLGFHDFVNDTDKQLLSNFYTKLYPASKLSICTCSESESTKLYCNAFYATKIQFFNEMYLTCGKLGIDYTIVKNMMLANAWINPMHTSVPGYDGQLSFGGACFPKDITALATLMKSINTRSSVIEAVIAERNDMRKDEKKT